MSLHKVIGIDLGTSYSVVFTWDYDKKDIVVIPSIIGGSNTVPSIVGLAHDGNIIVGISAQNNLIIDPVNTIIEVKREIGIFEREPNAQNGDTGEPRRIRFRGRAYLPEEISAFILMELKRQAENYIGESIHDAVITVPAYFKEPQKIAITTAAALAKLNVKKLIEEPIAAAIGCGFNKTKIWDKKRHIKAVYDMGGGTCDVSIIEVKDRRINVIETESDPGLGGGDIDDIITGYVCQQIKEKYNVDLSHNSEIWARIKYEAEMRKRELSFASSTIINLPFLTPQLHISIPIARITFESLIEGLLKESLDCVAGAIKLACKRSGIKRDEIEQVLLAGGSVRIPRIRKLLAEYMHMPEKDIHVDANPDEAVSRGAALVARSYYPSERFEGKEKTIDRMQSYYSLLGISRNAILKEIRDACYRKIEELNEKKCNARNLEEKQKLLDYLKEIHIAYDTLTRPKLREDYDRINARLIAQEMDEDIITVKQVQSSAPLVFISAKSEDFRIAKQVYEFLVSRGVPAFFSQESLPQLGDSDFREKIDQALDQAKHMIVVTSCKDYVESPWVKAEWGFFVNEKRAGRKSGNLITLIVGSLQLRDLPPGLRYYYAFNHNQQVFEDIMQYVSH